MRLIKMLGLAVVSALAAMAFVGAGTASADVLCEENLNDETGVCSDAASLDPGDLLLGLTLALKPATLLAGTFKVECHSTALGEVDSNEGSHVGLWGLLTLLTFEKCKGSCTGADGLGEPYLLLGDALELHALVTKHAKGGTPEGLLTGCALGDCKYAITLPVLLDVEGDYLNAEEEPLTRTSGLCPPTGKWDALYLLSLHDVDEEIYLVSLP